MTTLVILLLITLISVTQLSNANNQHQMVANLQQFNQTFNAAESALSQAFYGVENVTDIADQNMSAMVESVTTKTSSTINVTSLSDENMSVSLTYTATPDIGLRAGISLDASNADIMIRNVNFTVTSSAQIDNSGAISTVSRGVIYE